MSWKKHAGLKGEDHPSVYEWARCDPSGKSIGQKGADTHIGTTNVPLAAQARACWIDLHIKRRGGTNQLTSNAHDVVNASTASQLGVQNLLLYPGSGAI